MEILCKVRNEFPWEENKEPIKFKPESDGVIRKKKDIFILHDDGKIYKSFSGLPFITEIQQNQLFKLINVNENMFILKKMDEWPEGTSKDNGITSKISTSREDSACWYMHEDGRTMPTYLDVPLVENYRKANKSMPVLTCQMLL